MRFLKGMKKTFQKTLMLGGGEGIFEPWPVGFAIGWVMRVGSVPRAWIQQVVKKRVKL